MKKIFLVIAMILMLGIVVGCQKDPVVELTYTVTFDSNGGSPIDDQVILNGGKVTRPADPTKEGFLFDGKWMNGTFEWDFAIDIVTEDITLVAGWIEVSTTPTNIHVSDDLFSSTLVWQQTDAELQTFVVSIKPLDGGAYTVVPGTVEIESADVLDTVTFTPTDIPLGGYYIVKVEAGSEVGTRYSLLLGGAGTVANPYLVSKGSEVIALLEDDMLADKAFLQVSDVLTTLTQPIEINNDRQISFSGVWDGGNYSISFTGNGGLFHEITSTGVVKNLTVSSTTVLSAQEGNDFPIGAIANTNNGLIENITGGASLTNADIQGFLPVFNGVVDTTDTTTGAGGIAGINGETGIIRNVTVSGAGAVKAGRGVGGVTAYNYGLIEFATVTATLPAGNQANSARSSNTYSFGGGITGFNFGTISKSVVSGRVFAQSAYSTTGDGNEGKNVAFGGIAGYNEGLITETSFARSIISAKEFIPKDQAEALGDSANNLGVASIHGDLYIGGIAGINAGEITDVYVGGALIGGRDFVGGVTGLTLTGGTISNTYVFANVSIKDDGGLKVTVAGDKTTLTTYDIAPSGFDVNSVFFRELLNSSTNNNWVPGDLEAPMLPEFTGADLTMVGNKFASSGVLLWQQGAVTGVDILLDTIVLPYGATQALDFAVTPSNAPDTFTVWTSSDDQVVEILGEGVIRGIAAGTATVTVTTRDGSYTDTIEVTVENYEMIDSVTVTADVLTLPAPNNSEDRLPVDIGTVVTFTVDILPVTADYQNFTLSSSNSRATVEGNVVTFLYGNTGPGNVSITVTFEDASVAALEYRFLTVQPVVDVPISGVTVTTDTVNLPEENNSEERFEVAIGTVATFTVDILPLNATTQTYTITSSNDKATVAGNVVTFVLGSGVGDVDITITFDDTAQEDLVYQFTTAEVVADVPIDSVVVTADVLTLPEVNNSEVRDQVFIGTVVTLTIDILPGNATNQNYTVTTSNSRASVEGNVVTFLYGNTGPGSVSIKILFEDTTVGVAGLLEYRFTTVEVVPVTDVTVTTDVLTLPEANNSEVRDLVEIGTVATFTVDILPLNASYQGYTITTSNSRATVDGNVVTFVYGNTGPGSVSVVVTFDDPSVASLEYRFTTFEPVVPITSVTVTADTLTLPNVNDSLDRLPVVRNTIVTLTIDILPADASNQTYVVTISNSRATVDGNVVTFGTSTVGSVSIKILFEDTTVGVPFVDTELKTWGMLEYRFTVTD